VNEDSTGRRSDAAAKPGNPATGRGCHIAKSACFSSMAEGWIKIHRKLLESYIMRDPVVFKVWLHILLNVTHKPFEVMFKGDKVLLQPGQWTFGRRQLSRECGVSEMQARRALKVLEKNQQINQQKSNRCSLLTVINWSKYQGDNQQNNQQTTSRQPTDNQQTTTKQECKTERMEESSIGDDGSLSLHVANNQERKAPGNLQLIESLKQTIGSLYNRKPNKAWSYAEQSALAEIATTEDVVAELDFLKQFAKDKFFPQSVFSLLTNWQPTLDRYRTKPGRRELNKIDLERDPEYERIKKWADEETK
jgi:hypothetical protein